MFVGKVSEIEYERFKSFLDDCDGFKKSEIRIMKLVTICYESIGFLIFVAILTFLTYLINLNGSHQSFYGIHWIHLNEKLYQNPNTTENVVPTLLITVSSTLNQITAFPSKQFIKKKFVSFEKNLEFMSQSQFCRDFFAHFHFTR